MGTLILKDLCEITSSKRVFASDYVNHGVPFYRGKEITEYSISGKINTAFYISNEKYQEISQNYGVPKCNDILITAVGTLGSLMLVNNEKFYFKDGNIIWLKNIKNDLALSKYIFYYLGYSKNKNSLINSAIGSTQKAFTIEIIKNFKINIPSFEMQQHIVNTISFLLLKSL